jgi:hypothetical protein
LLSADSELAASERRAMKQNERNREKDKRLSLFSLISLLLFKMFSVLGPEQGPGGPPGEGGSSIPLPLPSRLGVRILQTSPEIWEMGPLCGAFGTGLAALAVAAGAAIS